MTAFAFSSRNHDPITTVRSNRTHMMSSRICERNPEKKPKIFALVPVTRLDVVV